MSRPAGLVVLGLCLSLTGAATVSARSRPKPARVSLEYRKLAGAERCPSRAQLESQVNEILRRPSFAKTARRKVRCVLGGKDGGIAARVQLVDTRSGRVLGVRELSGSGPSCEELGGAVALAIALAIDPLARPPSPPPPPVTATPGASAAGSAGADAGTVGPIAAGPGPTGSVKAGSGTTGSRSSGSARPGSAAGSGAAGVAAGVAAAGAAGSGAAGTVATRPPLSPGRPPPPPPPHPPPSPATRPPDARAAPDAGPLATLGLIPLVAALVPDAGVLLPPVRDAGALPAAIPDAGVGLPDAGPPPVVDAGVPPAAADAGPAALAVDAGPEERSPDAGVPPELAAGPAVAASEAAATGWRPVVGVGAVGTVGTLPGVAGGVLLHAGAASSTASIEVEGRWLPGTSTQFGSGSVSTSMVSGALVGCARFGSWAACGLAQAGPLSARGQGYSRTEEGSAWMVSVGARGQWEWVFADPIGLRLHLDAAANLIRPRLLVDSQAAWTAPPVSVSVGGGLFGRF
jgi:hypothetical protein